MEPIELIGGGGFVPLKMYRVVPGFPAYRAGTDGTVWSCWKKGNQHSKPTMGCVWKQLHPAIDKRTRYRKLTLVAPNGSRKTMEIHRLILLTFIGPKPKGLATRHLDGNRLNNSLFNLVYGTYSQNNGEDRYAHGTMDCGERRYNAKLTTAKVKRIRRLKGQMTHSAIAMKLKVSRPCVTAVLGGRAWKHVK